MLRGSHHHQSLLPLPWIFFLSGFPALVYQTAWQRILVLHSGVGSVSVATIVSAYMLGLGVGSLIGARLSKQLSPLTCLRWFGTIEFLTGLCGFFSPQILYKLLYLKFGSLYGDVGTSTLLHIGVLFVPTALMGATLPLMARALVRHQDAAPGLISRLYAMNTLGAAAGAIVTPWLIVPISGVTGAIYFAAAMNGLAGLIVFLGNARAKALNAGDAAQTSVTNETSPSPAEHSRSTPMSVWLLVYFLSGLCAIGLEIIWFRILDVGVKSTAFTFGTMLGLFLFYLAMGSFLGAKRVRAVQEPFYSFLLIQCWIVLLAALPILLIVYLPPSTPGLEWYVGYWAAEEPFRPSLAEPVPSILLYLVLPSILMAPATMLMGYSFSVLQKGIQADASVSGYKVGILQAGNILGCTVGSLICGLILLHSAGTANTLRCLMTVGVVMTLVGGLTGQHRRSFLVMAVLIVGMIAVVPQNQQIWLRLHGQNSDSETQVAEDMTGVSALTRKQQSDQWWIWANGKTQSLLPYGGFHTKLGVIPATFTKKADSIAIIGLGSGDTAWAAACRSETQQVRVFEICTPEITLLDQESSRSRWPQVDQLFSDPRVTIDPRDARYVLMTDEATYDVIEADAVRHHSAFAGYLYSVEFFELCRRRLNPGGVMCTWSPTPTVHATFRRAFPHVIELEQGLLLIGSNEPLEIDPAEWEQRIRDCIPYLGPQIAAGCIESIQQAQRLQPHTRPSS